MQRTRRVIHRQKPYLVTYDDAGGPTAAYGPFIPGTEPSEEECSDATRVRDGSLEQELFRLGEGAPAIPPGTDHL